MSSLGLAPSYVALVTLLMIAGLGVAAFHPGRVVSRSRTSPGLDGTLHHGDHRISIGPMFAGRGPACGLERTCRVSGPVSGAPDGLADPERPAASRGEGSLSVNCGQSARSLLTFLLCARPSPTAS
jgi:hypothetical protein